MKNNDFIKVKRVTETAIMPEAKTEWSAGYDLHVDITEPVIVPPHETVFINSGIAMAIPEGYFGGIYARSGISSKLGIRPATCVSVIDSDYRGDIVLPMHNDTDEPKAIAPGERVAQLIIHKVPHFELVLVDELEETERGSGGFGSTGR